MRFIPLAVVAVLILGAVPVIGQQANPAALPLSPTNNVLYAHHHSSDTVETTGWMNTLPGDGDDTALGAAATCQTHTQQQAVDEALLPYYGSAVDRTYTITLQPEQRGTMILNKAGLVAARLYVGAGSCYGKVDVTSTLLAGTVKVAESTKTGVSYYRNAATYTQADLSSAPLVTEVPLAELTWKIRLNGRFGNAVFLGVGPVSTTAPRGTSQLTLPILDVQTGAAEVYIENVTGEFSRQHSWANASNDTHIYNWTTEGGNYLLDLNASLAAGSVQLLVRHDSTELVNLTLEADLVDSRAVELPPGVLNVTLQAQAAVGALAFGLRLAPQIENPTGGPATLSATASAQETPADGGQETPVPVGIALAALVLAGWAWRRR